MAEDMVEMFMMVTKLGVETTRGSSGGPIDCFEIFERI